MGPVCGSPPTLPINAAATWWSSSGRPSTSGLAPSWVHRIGSRAIKPTSTSSWRGVSKFSHEPMHRPATCFSSPKLGSMDGHNCNNPTSVGPNEGKGGGRISSAQNAYRRTNGWPGPVQTQCSAPEQNEASIQSHSGVLAQNGAHQPFPPPLPRASPMQLLQEIRQGLSGYELNRLVAIGATQRVLTKHLHKMSKHAVRMGLLFTERAKKKCHTEHLRLIQLFMEHRNSEPVPTTSSNSVSGGPTHSPEGSGQLTYKKLRRQLACAPPNEQKGILFSHLQHAVEALQRPVLPCIGCNHAA